MIFRFVAGLALSASVALVPPAAPAQTVDPQMQSQAQQLCSIAVGALALGQFSAQQVLGQQALQVVMQQTNGAGVYPALRQLGQLSTIQVVNPHFDQDQQYGQLLHFYCMSLHQQGGINWELKYAPSTGKIEYFSMQPVQQPQSPNQQPQLPGQQPQLPGQQQPQFPNQQPQFPNQQPHQQPWPTQQQPQFPGQQMPQFPNQQQPQFPGQQTPQAQGEPAPQFPQQQGQGTPAPSRDEACAMFPGMC